MAKDATAVKDEVVIDSTVVAPAAPEEETVDGSKDADTSEQVAEKDVMEQSLDELSEDQSLEDETEAKEEVTPPVADETKPEPLKGADQRKDQLKGEIEELSKETGVDPNTEIRDLVAKRNALRDLQDAKARETQLASESELLNEVNPETGEYYTPQEANRLARAQALEQQQETAAQERYQAEVRQNQITLDGEASQALKDFPIFDPQSADYKPEIATEAAKLIDQNLIRDPNTPELDANGQPTGRGMIIGSNLSPYALLKTIADATKSGADEGQINGQKASEKMLAETDTPGGASHATPKKADPMLEAFDEEAAL